MDTERSKRIFTGRYNADRCMWAMAQRNTEHYVSAQVLGNNRLYRLLAFSESSEISFGLSAKRIFAINKEFYFNTNSSDDY